MILFEKVLKYKTLAIVDINEKRGELEVDGWYVVDMSHKPNDNSDSPNFIVKFTLRKIN